MIPALIVPILNRPELLDAMLGSVRAEVGQTIVVDNGGVVGDLPGTHVISLPHNIGVGAAWNLGMKVTPLAAWWLFVNSDITFGPGDLDLLQQTVDPDAEAIYLMPSMSCFALTYGAVERVGYFDENFHPAYNEDLDYVRRAVLAGVPIVELPFTGVHVGSATIYHDQRLRDLNWITHGKNDTYYALKWGGTKQGKETFLTPFDKQGDVGDWRLDARRLADQAWRKAE